MSTRKQSTRRKFVQNSAAMGAGFWIANSYEPAFSKSPNEKINVAGIGCGGKGHSDIMKCANAGQNIVAGTDIDMGRAKKLAKDASKKQGGKMPELFSDWRKMLDKVHKDIDAVTVSTPDHSHAVAASAALSLGKHVYVQKPLTHTVHECRVLRKLAKEQKVCTQMGNQGTAGNGLRGGVEMIQSGAIGEVKEVHVWSNRPVWSQGQKMMDDFEKGKGAKPPGGFDFNLWLGPASDRPFNKAYRHFHWRGLWDFGTGALGDMACHTMNLPFMALELQYPKSMISRVPKVYPITPPEWSVISFDFPERTVVKTGKKLAPVALTWYDGTRTGLPQDARTYATKLKEAGVDNPSNSGSLFIGSKGFMYSPGDYGDRVYLLPKDKFEGYEKPKAWLPRQGGGDQGQTNEWLDAIKKNDPSHAMSNFEYSAYFTEIILLGNLAMRVPGKKIEWDGPNMKSTNSPEANEFVTKQYRKGFELRA
jgi:hypothetical protein